MNYVLLSSPRKILQLPPRQPLNSEQAAAMLLVTITPWLKGVFMGICRDGSLSHQGPVSLHAPDHTHSPLSRDVTVATRQPSREHGGPPTAAVAGPAGNSTPRHASSSHWPAPPRRRSLPWGLGPRPSRFRKRRQAEDRRDLQQPFENSPQSSTHQNECCCPRCTISLSTFPIVICLATLGLSCGTQDL